MLAHQELIIIILSIIIVLLFAKYTYKILIKILDQKIYQISHEIDSSKKDLSHSESNLQIIKDDLYKFIYNKDSLIYKAQYRIDNYYEQKLEALNETFYYKQMAIDQYINNMYKENIQKTHITMINSSISIIKDIIHNEITDEMHNNYINQSILEIKGLLNK